jgi:hypothetical protein
VRSATPAEILALATAGALSTPDTTIQINHISSHFQPLKIDTSLVPPRDLMTDLERARRRLPSTGAVPNLFQHYPALELWNGNARSHQAEFLVQRIGIWMNHLNQGLRTTFIADTDSHLHQPELSRARTGRLADRRPGDRRRRRGHRCRGRKGRGRTGRLRADAAAGDRRFG